MDTKLPPYATFGQRLWFYGFRVICGMIFFFLIAPIVTIIPLSFNAEDFFTFTPGMLALDPEAYSLRHYRAFFGEAGYPLTGLLIGLGIGIAITVALRLFKGSKNYFPIVIFAILGVIVGKLTGLEGEEWMTPMRNSLRIAPVATLLSVSFGTLAAIGLSQSHVPFKGVIMAILISPMIVPLIIS
ncbi:MAG TPA: ABC transporter permease, partial [Roseibacterium sp.]|nr:ABC transporter permease [Roseibacterium sp.]